MSTHHLDEVQRVADRVAVVRSRLVALDTPAALRARLFGTRLRVVLAQPASRFAATANGPGIGAAEAHGATLTIDVDDAAGRAPAIVRQLVTAGAEIQSVTPDEPTLEQVYLRLVEDKAHR
jgi:ABC-2 type transport system ATP-binding protein